MASTRSSPLSVFSNLNPSQGTIGGRHHDCLHFTVKENETVVNFFFFLGKTGKGEISDLNQFYVMLIFLKNSAV